MWIADVDRFVKCTSVHKAWIATNGHLTKDGSRLRIGLKLWIVSVNYFQKCVSRVWIVLVSVYHECESVHEVWNVNVDRFEKCGYFHDHFSLLCITTSD